MMGTFLPKTNRRSDTPPEAALMTPREAAWLAWYMCLLSLGLAAFGLLLLVLGHEARPGVPVFERWAEDAVVAVGFSTAWALVAPPPSGWAYHRRGVLVPTLGGGGAGVYRGAR